MLALALWMTSGPAGSDTRSAILDDPGFADAYRTYYDALDGYGPEDLRLELTETIEDALIGGSHLNRPSIDYKRRQIERALRRQTQDTICGQAPDPANTRGSCADAALAAATEAGADLGAPAIGAIAAVCARLAEGSARGEWCSTP